MSDDSNEEVTMIRKVYMLPRELVDRIGSFQQDKRLPSEVEAVRRLLDEALKYRDTPELIVDRIKERLKTNGLIHAVGNDVLREHPLIATIDQADDNRIGFSMKSGRVFRVFFSGRAEEKDTSSNGYSETWDPFPIMQKAISKDKPRSDLDDEIPF